MNNFIHKLNENYTLDEPDAGGCTRRTCILPVPGY